MPDTKKMSEHQSDAIAVVNASGASAADKARIIAHINAIIVQSNVK